MIYEVKEIISLLSKKVYIIEEEMETRKRYKTFRKTIYDYIKSGFEIKELRECPVYFRFHQNTDMHQIQLRHFLTNIMFWEPMLRLGAISKLSDEFIVDCSQISSKYISNYINKFIVHPYINCVDLTELNIVISDMIYNLSLVSIDFNLILGVSMDIESFIDVAERNPRFNEIIHTKLEDNMQPVEIEAKLHKLMKEEIDILMNEDTHFKPILRAGAGIKHKQLSEYSISGGMKPDLQGNTIPIPINSNLITGGLNTVTNYFIDSKGGRKSLIMNSTAMGKSGHFASKTKMASSNVLLREDDKPCRSVHGLKQEVKTEEHFKRFLGRYYRLPYEMKYHLLTEDDKSVIGKTILLKSPLTCASKHGVCKMCYGDTMYMRNKDINIGAYAAALITNPVSQNILSTKHLLTTDSIQMEFDDDFRKFFNLSGNEISIRDDDDTTMNYTLVIIGPNVSTVSELDEGSINRYLPLVHVLNNKTGKMIEISEKNGALLYITPELSEYIPDDPKTTIKIPFDDLASIPLFLLEIGNNELTKPLYDIVALLDNSGKREKMGIDDIDSLAQKMLDLLIESHITCQAIHGEVILSALIRSEADILKRPDFRKYDAMEDVKIMTVTTSLEKNPSPTLSLSFEYLRRQLQSPLTFKKKGKSYIDPFFRETLKR